MKRTAMMLIRLPKFLIFLYLFPIFVTNLDMGPSGELFFRSQFLFYPIVILIVQSVYGGKGVFYFSFFFIFLMLVYMVLISINFGGYQFDLLGGWIVYLLYILATYSVVQVVKDIGWEEFQSIFNLYVVVVVILILSSFLIWKITGFYFLADDGYGYHRPHALFSEPSACAFFLSYGFLYSYFSRHYLNTFIVALAVAITGSILAVIILFLVYVYGYLKERSVFHWIFVSFIAFVLFYVGYNFILDYSPSGGGLDSQVLRVRQAIISVETFGESGYNPRLNTTIDMFDFMRKFEWSWLIGFGPGADTYLPFSVTASSGSSLITVLLFNFGLLGLSVYIFLALKILSKLAGGTGFWFYTVCIFLTTALNSAQGMLIYQLMLFIILLGFGYEKIKISSPRP